MKRIKLLLCLAYAILAGWLLFEVVHPKEARILLVPDHTGSYSMANTHKNFSVSVEESDHRIIDILYEPRRRISHYVFPVLMAIMLGIAVFGSSAFSSDIKTTSVDPRLVTGHKLYSEFVSEDYDRAFFTGDELVAVFTSWLNNRQINR